MTGQPLGPFETERQARMAALAATEPDEDSLLTAAGNRKLLGRALQAAGVAMGRYDDRILEWFARWEPSTCAVAAGWVTRACTAGQASAADDTRRLDAIRALLAGFDWEHDDRQYAIEAIERIADGGQA